MSGSEIVVSYEELRRQALDSASGMGGGWGLTLFLRQGMQSWMEAWSQCRPPELVGDRKKADSLSIVPLDLRGEVVKILAAMALHRQWEGRA
jgi:hypothetical protein